MVARERSAGRGRCALAVVCRNFGMKPRSRWIASIFWDGLPGHAEFASDVGLGYPASSSSAMSSHRRSEYSIALV